MNMAKKAMSSAKKASRTVPSKKAAKKTSSRVVAAKKAASVSSVAKKKYDEAITKSEMFTTIADQAGITRKQVAQVFDCLAEIIHGHIKPKAVGACAVAGLLKVEVKRKPATKARKGINPFTGEETMFKAKPARNVVKVKALKKLKSMVD